MSDAHAPSWAKPLPTAATRPRSGQTNAGLLGPRPKTDGDLPWSGQRLIKNSAHIIPERDAVRVVEELYGSLEEFGAYCVFDEPDMLNPEVAISKKTEISGVPAGALGALLSRSMKFRGVLRSALANQVFDVASEANHLRVVAGIAANRGRTVLTKNGSVAQVDNSERGVMDAGEYLNKYRGTPLSGAESGGGNTLVLNFQGAPEHGGEPGSSQHDPSRTVTVAGKELRPHSPLRAGALPPEAVRGRYKAGYEGEGEGREGQGRVSQAGQDPLSGVPQGVMGTDLDFASGGASDEQDFFSRSRYVREPSSDAVGAKREPQGGSPPKPEPESSSSFRARLDRALSGKGKNSGGGFAGYGAGASTPSEGFGEGVAASEGEGKPRKGPGRPKSAQEDG